MKIIVVEIIIVVVVCIVVVVIIIIIIIIISVFIIVIVTMIIVVVIIVIVVIIINTWNSTVIQSMHGWTEYLGVHGCSGNHCGNHSCGYQGTRGTRGTPGVPGVPLLLKSFFEAGPTTATGNGQSWDTRILLLKPSKNPTQSCLLCLGN